MIVATADDVDHRKASLVMALTGIDTDRLAEEKRRGLLIDLGFAPADLGGDALIGFIDLPGHEGFIRNMVAGVASIDLALLVVAGAVVSGQACVGDALIVSPQGTAVRLRGIQTHGRAMAEARRGQRCALNLVGAGLKRESVKRGDWVVAPAAHAPTDCPDVRLGASNALAQALLHANVLQRQLAAAAVPARLATLQGLAIEPGREGFAQLVLERRKPHARGRLGGRSVRLVTRSPNRACASRSSASSRRPSATKCRPCSAALATWPGAVISRRSRRTGSSCRRRCSSWLASPSSSPGRSITASAPQRAATAVASAAT